MGFFNEEELKKHIEKYLIYFELEEDKKTLIEEYKLMR
jgi:hypothetical protein